MTEHVNPRIVIGNNNPPAPTPFEAISQEIADLFDEAKNFCDGSEIDSQKLADAITELHDKLHDAGKRADELRVIEKKPLDDQIADIQARYNKLIGNTKAVKGTVILGKEACQTLLTPWRTKILREKEAEAARIREEAERVRKEAEAAIRASSGNLEARVDAEEVLAHSKAIDKTANRAEKAATTGTGLRTIWTATMIDEEQALDWAFGAYKLHFIELVQSLADGDVRGGARDIPGFSIKDSKVAR